MKQEQHAERAWIVLVCAAMNRQIITYKHLGEKLGIPPQGLGGILSHLLRYCDERRIPKLTSIVVSKQAGVPGTGFGSQVNLDAFREKVFAYAWHLERAPRWEELVEYALRRNAH